MRTERLNLPLEPSDTAQPHIIFDELINWIEAGNLEFTKDSLTSDMTIPSGSQYIVYGAFDIQSTLTLDGILVTL